MRNRREVGLPIQERMVGGCDTWSGVGPAHWSSWGSLDGKPSVPLCPPVSLFPLTGGKRLGVLEQQQAELYRPRVESPPLSPITSSEVSQKKQCV